MTKTNKMYSFDEATIPDRRDQEETVISPRASTTQPVLDPAASIPDDTLAASGAYSTLPQQTEASNEDTICAEEVIDDHKIVRAFDSNNLDPERRLTEYNDALEDSWRITFEVVDNDNSWTVVNKHGFMAAKGPSIREAIETFFGHVVYRGKTVQFTNSMYRVDGFNYATLGEAVDAINRAIEK